MIDRKVQTKGRIGAFSVVHNTYFGQFEGLEDNLKVYHSVFVEKLRKNNVEVIDFGMVESSERS